MTARLITLTSDDALFDEAVEIARKSNMHLIGNGKRIVISPVVPPGWFKIAVKVKCPHTASLQPATRAA